NCLLTICPLSFSTLTYTHEFYTLSLHDALPISTTSRRPGPSAADSSRPCPSAALDRGEHSDEQPLQPEPQLEPLWRRAPFPRRSRSLRARSGSARSAHRTVTPGVRRSVSALGSSTDIPTRRHAARAGTGVHVLPLCSVSAAGAETIACFRPVDNRSPGRGRGLPGPDLPHARLACGTAGARRHRGVLRRVQLRTSQAVGGQRVQRDARLHRSGDRARY